MIIDIHTHTFPDRMADATVEHLSKVSHTVPFTHGKNSELTESMRRAGIDRSVVLPVATSARQVRSRSKSFGGYWLTAFSGNR